jgi:stress response protein YsnF
VDVQRVRVDRPIDHVPPVRVEGDTTIVPVVEEVLVVEKRLILREEVRLTARRSEHHNPKVEKLRSEEVIVERVEQPGQEKSRE